MATTGWWEPMEDPAAGRRADRAASRWFVHPFVVLTAVVALAGGLRFYRLSSPPVHVFDEVYYAKDACFDAGFPYRRCGLETPGEQTFSVHPPLGRWIIAAGELAFGNSPFGWRVASAAFGTVCVLLAALLGLVLLRGAVWAGVSGVLLATESLHFVQSRISMLDIFLATFVVAGFLFLALDRRWIDRRTPTWTWATRLEGEEDATFHLPHHPPPSPILRPWRFAAGLAFGAGVASKWSGAFALLGAVGLALGWERTRRKRLGVAHPFRKAVSEESFGVVLALVVVPLLVYVASYARWFVDNGLDLAGWWEIQLGMARYSIELDATHPYASRAWSWLVLRRPVAYYYECPEMQGDECLVSSEILGIGNPAIFWSSLLSLPYLLFAWVGKRKWRAGLVFVAVMAQYLPWFVVGRTSFLFYMTPVTPFLVLAAAYGLRDLAKVRVGSARRLSLAPLAWLLVAVSVGTFLFFLPVLTGRSIPHPAWEARMWFRSWI